MSAGAPSAKAPSRSAPTLAMAQGGPSSPQWRRLLATLQLEFDQLHARNEALVAQNCTLAALLQQGSPLTDKGIERTKSIASKSTGSMAMVASGSEKLRLSKKADCASELQVDEVLLDEAADGKSEGCQSRTSETIRATRELRSEFRCLCQDGRTSVCAEELHAMWDRQVPRSWNAEKKQAAVANYKAALHFLNGEIHQKFGGDSVDLNKQDEMQAQTYVLLFQSKEWVSTHKMSRNHKKALQQICQVVMNSAMTRDIAYITDIDPEKLYMRHRLTTAEKCICVMDGISSALILLNMATLTLSLDIYHAWPGWQMIETAFIGCFFIEICLRLGIVGFQQHFCGPDAGWNIFDLFVVMSSVGTLSREAAQVTGIRILRLLRIVKMVRVLRIKMLKELRLIVIGLLGGLRTIFWGIVFLFFFILTLGVSTKQFLSAQPDDPSCDNMPWGCTGSEKHLHRFRRELFSSVPRCMFTLFRCFVADGCTSLDGTPIMPFLWDQYGVFICLGYVFCFLFLTFGLFNLIMATIVESTMEAGKLEDSRRRCHHDNEHLRVALAVKDLVRALCCEEEQSSSRYRDFMKSLRYNKHWWETDHSDVQVMLKSRISTKVFLEMLENNKVRALLDKLGITSTDPNNYIEAFDANEDGMLSIAELVRGLLKLRGRVEKADIIAGLMVSRDLQKSMKSIEAMLVRAGIGESPEHRRWLASTLLPRRGGEEPLFSAWPAYRLAEADAADKCPNYSL